MAGVLGQGLNGGSLSGMYASRFIAGIGIGATTVVPPMYITEASLTFYELFDPSDFYFFFFIFADRP